MAAGAAAGIQLNIVENQRQSMTRRPGCTGAQVRLSSGSRARKSKVIRRSITLKSLAADFEILKNEVQDLKKELVSSQALPNKRYPKKRVTFQDNVS
ncbi:hypothetical protein HAV15_012156 [Penicillium sp. str. |nr:hypothetical protein HAV15_012156 [Penicillium sp. str. \